MQAHVVFLVQKLVCNKKEAMKHYCLHEGPREANVPWEINTVMFGSRNQSLLPLCVGSTDAVWKLYWFNSPKFFSCNSFSHEPNHGIFKSQAWLALRGRFSRKDTAKICTVSQAWDFQFPWSLGQMKNFQLWAKPRTESLSESRQNNKWRERVVALLSVAKSDWRFYYQEVTGKTVNCLRLHPNLKEQWS